MSALSEISQRLRAAEMIVRQAELHELPPVYDVTVTNHSATTLYVDSVDDLHVWALWLESTVETRATALSAHTTAEGSLFDEPLKVVHVEFSVAEVSA